MSYTKGRKKLAQNKQCTYSLYRCSQAFLVSMSLLRAPGRVLINRPVRTSDAGRSGRWLAQHETTPKMRSIPFHYHDNGACLSAHESRINTLPTFCLPRTHKTENTKIQRACVLTCSIFYLFFLVNLTVSDIEHLGFCL